MHNPSDEKNSRKVASEYGPMTFRPWPDDCDIQASAIATFRTAFSNKFLDQIFPKWALWHVTSFYGRPLCSFFYTQNMVSF